MEIIKATSDYSKDISRLMLSDLAHPDPRFPSNMISSLREHAQDKNIKKEFNNPKLLLFLAIHCKNIIGFIVGYEESTICARIDYISAQHDRVRKKLFDYFVKECQSKKITLIIADAFEFMDNNAFFKS